MLDHALSETLEQHLERWAATQSSCAPADRKLAEAGIARAYRAAGLAFPERIVWCGGPVEIARRLASASADDRIGSSVKAQIFDNVRAQASTFAEIFWPEAVTAAAEAGGKTSTGIPQGLLGRARNAGPMIDRAVCRAANEVLFRPSVQVRYAFQRWLGLPRVQPRADFSEIAVGPEDFAALALYEYLGDQSDWRYQAEPLRGLSLIAKSASWIVPHEHVCWVAERPDTLHIDAAGRLHCVDGPALRFRDGWSVYAWKGVEVPAWMIEHPERITASRIDDTFEPDLRNTMIDIMTPERFVATGVPSRISKDETGILWRRQWTYRHVVIGTWCAVEVVNGTAEQDGSYRHHFLRVPANMRTAREAVAWTYGLTAGQYAKLELRT